MQVFGNLVKAPERREGKSGPFYTFRLGENHGQGAQRTTTWYDVLAFIDELDADILDAGSFVKVTGRLVAEAFMRRDNTPGASLKILAFSVEPVARKDAPGSQASDNSAGQGSPADQMDDDIPF